MTPNCYSRVSAKQNLVHQGRNRCWSRARCDPGPGKGPDQDRRRPRRRRRYWHRIAQEGHTDAVAAIKKQRTATAAALAEAEKQRSGAHDAHNAAHQAWWEEGELTGEWKDTVLRSEYIVRVIKDDDKNLAAAEKVSNFQCIPVPSTLS